ncbi:MAG: 8-oxo-dGTP diphosphatase [Alphaproteobacteria bacterium]|nr:8-oxo-dGTP diphosphatase [Alphaproteobacteria bacterium]
MRGTLLFVLHDDHALLIRKKRGLGEGKINAPGGKIDPGETAVEAAVREVQEEVCVTALDPEHRGELWFQFVDGLRLHVHVFTARRFQGEPAETDEALPLWIPLAAMPYDEMWADDRVWVPRMLAGQRFELHAIFDADRMVDHRIRSWPGD